MNIKIIGTNHLMSHEEVNQIIKRENPEVIGIELCQDRVNAIIKNYKPEKNENRNLLQKITDKIKSKAEESGLDYGSDMKTALKHSIDNNIPYVLVDMPIIKTQELFLKIPKEEQEGFAKELTEFQNVSINEKVNDEEVLLNLKTRYPIAFEFLINMRNLFITKEILRCVLENQDKKILIILGSSHVENVKKLIGGEKWGQ